MTYRYRKKHGWVGLLLVVLTTALTVAQQEGWLQDAKHAAITNQPGLYSVTQFVDGDTLEVDMNGRPEKIRLIGVDTPETHKPKTPVQCYGLAAAAFTKNVIGTQQLRLVSDSLSTDRDRYKRLLRYVYLPDGTNLNQKIIETGHGFYYPYFPFTKSDEFALAQKTAQEGSKGLWGNCQPTPTDRGGYNSNPIGT